MRTRVPLRRRDVGGHDGIAQHLPLPLGQIQGGKVVDWTWQLRPRRGLAQPGRHPVVRNEEKASARCDSHRTTSENLRSFTDLRDRGGRKLRRDKFEIILWERSRRTSPRPPTLAEQHAAKRLGIPVNELQDLAMYLWGEPLDRLITSSLEPDSSPQARGHVTRSLLSELEERLP